MFVLVVTLSCLVSALFEMITWIILSFLDLQLTYLIELPTYFTMTLIIDVSYILLRLDIVEPIINKSIQFDWHLIPN